MNDPPDHTDELRAANLLSFCGDDRAEVGLHQLGVLAQGGVHVGEDHAHALEVFAVAVEDDLGLVLGGDAGQVLALRLGDAELLVGALDRLREHVPVADLPLGGLDVVVDVVEVDAAEVGAPVGHGPAAEVAQRLEPVVAHPLGLALHPRHLVDDVVGQAPLRLEDVLLLVAPAELVAGEIDADVGGRHGAADSMSVGGVTTRLFLTTYVGTTTYDLAASAPRRGETPGGCPHIPGVPTVPRVLTGL